MRKLACLFFASLLSLNAYAGMEAKLNIAVSKTLSEYSDQNSTKNPFAIIYGGQDFSPQIAIANETIWPSQPVLIG